MKKGKYNQARAFKTKLGYLRGFYSDKSQTFIAFKCIEEGYEGAENKASAILNVAKSGFVKIYKTEAQALNRKDL